MSSRNKEKYDKFYNGTVERRETESRSDNYRKKSPLRVQNDWSEHISSKGLIYYYNCRTEVSQWQRPEQWTLPSMSPDEIKRLLNSKHRNGECNIKRNYPNYSVDDPNISPKRIKYNTQTSQPDKRSFPHPNNQCKVQKYDYSAKGSKPMSTTPNLGYTNSNVPSVNCTNNNNNNNNKCKYNDDDMDISPGSSPLSRGSHSSECDKKYGQLESETSGKCQLPKKVDKYLSSPHNEVNSSSMNSSKVSTTAAVTHNSIKVSAESTHSNNLTTFQVSLATSLRSALQTLQNRSSYSKDDASGYPRSLENCLSVYQISDLLIRLDAVTHNGETSNNYRLHRLQTQLSQQNGSSFSQTSHDPTKTVSKQLATVNQIKDLAKSLQEFLQDQYPTCLTSIAPISPPYSKANRISYYLQILSHLVETSLMQLCPQSLNSPSSTSSPGSLKDNNSTVSVSTSVNSQSNSEIGKLELDSPVKKERLEPDKPKSILHDYEMMKYVSQDVTNTYRNQLADYYEKEAQLEYYKFVRLHSVLYPELACESKKLKALVRISEINTELLRQKKEDLEKLIHMLESRRLPNHLKCDYLPNS